MALLPSARALYETLPLAAARRLLAHQAVRVIPLGDLLLICARNSEEVILVEPRLRKGGGLGLEYAIRDSEALAEWLDQPRKFKKESKHEYRTGQPRSFGRSRKSS